MVVVKDFGVKPMMLLTTLQIGTGEKDIWFILQAYLRRWSVEETIRFIKQTYDLKNIRVLKYALGDGLSNIFSRFPGQLQKLTEIHQTEIKSTHDALI